MRFRKVAITATALGGSLMAWAGFRALQVANTWPEPSHIAMAGSMLVFGGACLILGACFVGLFDR